MSVRPAFFVPVALISVRHHPTPPRSLPLHPHPSPGPTRTRVRPTDIDCVDVLTDVVTGDKLRCRSRSRRSAVTYMTDSSGVSVEPLKVERPMRAPTT